MVDMQEDTNSQGELMSLTEEEKRRIYEEEQLRLAMRGKSEMVALLLSVLVPGLGDFYCGSWIKGVVLFILGAVLLTLCFFTLGLSSFLLFPFWVVGLISAWFSARKAQARNLAKLGKKFKIPPQ